MKPEVDHIALQVANLDISIKFYTNILGTKLISKTVDKEYRR